MDAKIARDLEDKYGKGEIGIGNVERPKVANSDQMTIVLLWGRILVANSLYTRYGSLRCHGKASEHVRRIRNGSLENDLELLRLKLLETPPNGFISRKNYSQSLFGSEVSTIADHTRRSHFPNCCRSSMGYP